MKQTWWTIRDKEAGKICKDILGDSEAAALDSLREGLKWSHTIKALLEYTVEDYIAVPIEIEVEEK